MTPRTETALRWFVGLSLVAGSLALLAGAIQYDRIAVGGPWVALLAGVLAIVLCLVSIAADRRPWPAMAPAAGWILSVMLSILWAHLDQVGHAFLSGYASLVAFATGIGFLRRRIRADRARPRDAPDRDRRRGIRSVHHRRRRLARARPELPRAALSSRPQDDLDVHAVRHLDAHQLPQRALVRVEVDEPLVDAHLPAVPRLAALAVGGLADRHEEPLRRKRDRPGHRDARALGDELDLLAHVVDLLRVRSAQRDPRLLGHGST